MKALIIININYVHIFFVQLNSKLITKKKKIKYIIPKANLSSYFNELVFPVHYYSFGCMASHLKPIKTP